jgi:cellulose synthase/poly-beta-1,6-N-acetylglucosamine synthase-like glycosyltransferase
MNYEWLGWVLLVLCVFTWVVQVYYQLMHLSKTGYAKKEVDMNNTPPVSVIICAKNELKNLRTFLPSVVEQDYHTYQVVVVNDCSWDETHKYLEEMEDAYPHLKVVTIKEQEKYPHGKKLALTLGIKGAEYEWLLLTDADCKPASKDWIKTMARNFGGSNEIVLGYGAYIKESGILNKWIRFDTVYNALFYFSRAIQRQAYMGTGRNLAYRKSLYFRNKGFANHYHLISGDDDLFVNETATKDNTGVEIDPGSFTYSKPLNSFNEWLKQKKRHMSTGGYYKTADKLFLGAYFLSLTIFYISTIILLILKLYPELVVSMFIIRLIAQMIIFHKGSKKLGENDLTWLTPVFDIVLAFVYPVLSVSNLFIKTKSWK